MAPPLLGATSAPDTSVVPRSRLPVLVAVNLSAVTVPKVRSSTSVIATVPPVMSTAPTKSLSAFANVTSPAPAPSSVEPPTNKALPCYLSPSLLCPTSTPDTYHFTTSNRQHLLDVRFPTALVPRHTTSQHLITNGTPSNSHS